MKTILHHQLFLSVFGAPKLTLHDFTSLNEQLRPIAYYGLPIILTLAIVELIAQWREKNKSKFDSKESMYSVVVGLGYLASSYLTKALLFGAIVWCYNCIPWRMEFHWWMFVPCYIVHDFLSYWRHRISHQSRFWWSIHIPHHSANHYNLWINFRQSWFEQFCVIFYVPMLLIGFHPVLFFMVHQLNAILQFWVHTEYIGRLPKWIEFVFVTPTSHKVHHASNEKYLDKNFGNTFLVWDRIFGTFVEYTEEPVYGLTEPIHTNNVFRIVFDEAADIFRDMRKAKGIKNKLWNLFGSPAKIAAARKNKSAIEKSISSVTLKNQAA